MTNEEQRKFLRYVVKRLKACHHELTVYRAFAQVVKDAGVLDVNEVIEDARRSEDIQKATDAYLQVSTNCLTYLPRKTLGRLF